MASLARWRGHLQMEETVRQQQRRAQRQNNNEADVEAQQQPPAQQQDAFNAFVQATAPATAPAPPRLSRKQRQERESNATLFGPSLANYFPSSSSTTPSAATSSATSAAAAAAAAAVAQQTPTSPAAEQVPAFPPLTQIQSINSATLRRPRLGSSGRARGASLSNLSLTHLPHDPASPNVPASPSQQTRPLYGAHRRQYTTDSTWSWNHHHQSADPEDDLLDAPTTTAISGVAEPVGPLPLADAIQLGTVHRWLQRAAHGGGATLHPNSISANAKDITSPSVAAGATAATDHAADQGADGHVESIPLTTFGRSSASDSSPLSPLSPVGAPGASVCSILQSYVNLKRNTFRLTLGPAASTSYQHDLATPSAVSLPPHVLAPAPSAPILSHPTHILHFEYDCAAPRCAIHVFVRASRKHGSWNSALSHADYPQLLVDHQQQPASAASGTLLSPHPPPHILGFPILAATTILAPNSGEGVDIDAGEGMGTATSSSAEAYHLLRGFAQKRSVALRLDMSLYAPPSFPKKRAGDTNHEEEEEEEGEDKLDLTVENPTPGAADTTSAGLAPEVSTTAAAESKPKELAKEKDSKKQDRETLKAAIVVEALDEHGKPLSDPNLQTTYLRLSSIPAASPTAPTAVKASDGSLRIWSAQVEAQEAEIGPHRFQLQELFGLSSRPPPASLAAVPAATSTQDVTAVEGGGADGGDGGGGDTHADGEDGAGGDAVAPGGEVTPAEIPTEVVSPADDAGTTPITPTTAAYLPPNAPTDTATNNNAANGTATSTIFPISTTTSHPFLPSADEGTTGSECLICLTSPPSTLLLPCTHGLCLECAIQLRDSVKNARDAERRRGKMPRRKYACPVCRRAYTSMLHLSTADEKQVAQASAHGIV